MDFKNLQFLVLAKPGGGLSKNKQSAVAMKCRSSGVRFAVISLIYRTLAAQPERAPAKQTGVRTQKPVAQPPV